MKKLVIAALFSIFALSCVLTAWAQLPVTDGQAVVSVDALMHRKLESSQALLKGLALDDFELIKTESQRLQLLSLDAGWNTIQTPEYARNSTEFREAARKIRKAGEDKNLDAAGLGYFQLTMTCIDCHRHVRNVAKKRK